MKMLDLTRELKLRGLRVFRISDVARLTGKKRSYIYLLLSKSRLVLRAQNGVYYLPDTDPLEVASGIIKPSYISLLSAFAYYKLVDQVPNVVKVVTTKRHRSIENVQNMRVEFRTVKSSMLYGYLRERDIVIADMEKAVIDSLYLDEDVRYLDEAIKNATAEGKFDRIKLIKYAKMCGKKSVIKKTAKLLGALR